MNNTAPDQPKIIVALDYPTQQEALTLVKQLSPQLCRLKVGTILFTRYGPPFVELLMREGFTIFLDLKFHDIAQTVAGACRSAAELGVWMVNIHTLGGRAMMNAAREAIESYQQKPLLIGVTVLTSLNEVDLAEVGIGVAIPELVLHLAHEASQCGLDGVVCSAQEVSRLRQKLGAHFKLVTPGIRPALIFSTDQKDDQKRTMTPLSAIKAGADYLVIGRPITKAPNPIEALIRIHQEIQNQN